MLKPYINLRPIFFGLLRISDLKRSLSFVNKLFRIPTSSFIFFFQNNFFLICFLAIVISLGFYFQLYSNLIHVISVVAIFVVNLFSKKISKISVVRFVLIIVFHKLSDFLSEQGIQSYFINNINIFILSVFAISHEIKSMIFCVFSCLAIAISYSVAPAVNKLKEIVQKKIGLLNLNNTKIIEKIDTAKSKVIEIFEKIVIDNESDKINFSKENLLFDIKNLKEESCVYKEKKIKELNDIYRNIEDNENGFSLKERREIKEQLNAISVLKVSLYNNLLKIECKLNLVEEILNNLDSEIVSSLSTYNISILNAVFNCKKIEEIDSIKKSWLDTASREESTFLQFLAGVGFEQEDSSPKRNRDQLTVLSFFAEKIDEVQSEEKNLEEPLENNKIESITPRYNENVL